MAEDEYGFTKPPCPTEATKSGELYTMLSQFRAWVVNEQEELRPLLPPKSVTKLDNPAPTGEQTVWESVTSVYDKYIVATELRRCRHLWDHILRMHEKDWNCQNAIQQRFGVLEFSRWILAEAFLDPQTREAHRQKATHAKFARKWNKLLVDICKPLLPSVIQGMMEVERRGMGFGDDWWDSDEIGKDIDEGSDEV